MPKNDDEDGRSSRIGGKNQNGNGKQNSADEGDFVDEKTSCHPSTTSSRARRNWSVFSRRLRETLRRDSGQLGSLILFDLLPTSSDGSNTVTSSDCCALRSDSSDCMSDCSEFWWIALKSTDEERNVENAENLKIEGAPDEKRLKRTNSEVGSQKTFFRFSIPPRSTLDAIARGFDNTGNVRIWPGSEALAYCMFRNAQNSPHQKHAKVLELGAGFLGLTSFLLASTSSNSEFYITDGNPDSVKSLQKIRSDNLSKFSKNVKIAQLLWGESTLSPTKFDTILAADCVFFAELHEPLLNCIATHLKVGGACYLSSPRRKGSLEKFVEYVANSWGDRFELKGMTEWNEMLERKIGGLWRDEGEKDHMFPVVMVLKWKC